MALQTNPELEVELRFRDIFRAVHEQTGHRAWYSSMSAISRFWMY